MTGRVRPGAGSDRGSATVLVLGIALLIVAATSGSVLLSAAVCARHAAQAAADLAAVAGAQRIGIDGADGAVCAAAADSAAANGAALEACSVELAEDGRSGVVAVAVSRPVGTGALAQWTATARARAERMAVV